MTKDEALKEIRKIRTGCDGLDESQNMIREILDQIDQPQAEFTVRELVELLGQIKLRIEIKRTALGTYWLVTSESKSFQSQGFGIADLKAKLLELANPQPPSDKVLVPLDRDFVEFIAKCCNGDNAEACREALKGTQP